MILIPTELNLLREKLILGECVEEGDCLSVRLGLAFGTGWLLKYIYLCTDKSPGAMVEHRNMQNTRFIIEIFQNKMINIWDNAAFTSMFSQKKKNVM